MARPKGGEIDFAKLRHQYENIMAPPLELHFDFDLPVLPPSGAPVKADHMHTVAEAGIVQTLCRDPYAMLQPLASSANSANHAMRELVRTIVSNLIVSGSPASVAGAVAELERAIRNDTSSGRFCYELVRLLAPSFSPLSFRTVASQMREDMRFSPEILTFAEILLGGNQVDVTGRTQFDEMDDSVLSSVACNVIAAVVRRAANTTGFDFAGSFFMPSL